MADRVFEVKKGNHGHKTRPLQVKILSGKNLPNSDIPGVTGKSDPYCLCHLVGKPKTRLMSPTVRDNLNPAWNFTGEIPFYVQEDVLKFAVYDSDESKEDDLLGEATLPLKDLDSTGFTGELMLTKSGQGGKASIKIEVKPCPEHAMEVNPSVLASVSAEQARSSLLRG